MTQVEKRMRVLSLLEAGGFSVETCPVKLWLYGTQLAIRRDLDGAKFLLNEQDITLINQYGLDILWPSERADMDDGKREYLRAALSGEIDRVENAGEGERNVTLFKAVFALATLIPHLSEEEIKLGMIRAAESIGLSQSEYESVIRRAIRLGKEHPRGEAWKTKPIR